MVKVLYVNDGDYSLKRQSKESLKQWPASKLMEYHLQPDKLTAEDFKIIGGNEYLRLCQRYPELDREYAQKVNKQFIKYNLLVIVLLTLFGFLPFFYFSLSLVDNENSYRYLIALYFASAASFYYGASFLTSSLLEAVMVSKLHKAGRRLFDYELTKGLFAKTLYLWIFIAFLNQAICYGMAVLFSLG